MKQPFVIWTRTISWGNNFFPAFVSYNAALASTVEADAVTIIPPGGDGIARNLRIRAFTNPLAGAPGWALSVRKNGSDTALSCSIFAADGTTAINNTSNEIAFAEDDEISLNIIPVSGFPTDIQLHVSYEYETPSGARSVYGFGYHADSPSGTEYIGVFAGGAHWQSINKIDIVGVSGTVVGMNARLSAATGGGNSRTVEIMKGGSAQTGSVVVSNADFNKATVSIALAAGDQVAVRHTQSGSPTAAKLIGAITFDSDTPYSFNFAGNCTSSPSISAANYFTAVNAAYTQVWDATELTAYKFEAPITSVLLRNLRAVPLTNPPGTSKSFDLVLRKDSGAGSADTTQTVQITGNAVVVAGPSGGADVSLSVGDLFSFKSTPTGSPTSPSGLAWVFEGVVEPNTIICATVFGQHGTVTSSNTFLANLDETTRTVHAPNCMYVAGYWVLHEQGSAPTPIANTAILFTKDTGGKTELLVLFPTGSAIQIAIEA